MIPVLVILGAGSLGFLLGRQSLIIPLANEIRTVMQTATLGNLLTADEKEEVVTAYLEGHSSIAKIDEFSWTIFNVPTPFVGNGPMPGNHGNSTINTVEFGATVETVIPKLVGRFRIILTGGSTAFGSGAPAQDRTIAGYLEKLLTETPTRDAIDRYEVVTAANPAWATTHERILIENRLSELEPDLVISFSGDNDVN